MPHISTGLVGSDFEEDQPIYPLLKPFDWTLRAVVAHRNFLGIAEPPFPLVAYAHDLDEQYRFITVDEVTDLDALHGAAMRNLDTRRPEWQQVNPYLVTASGDAYSSEKVLCPEFIQQAGAILGTDRIQIAVPRRTVIYAAKQELSQQEWNEFVYAVEHTYRDDSFGNAPITNLIFDFTGGVLVGAKVPGSGSNR